MFDPYISSPEPKEVSFCALFKNECLGSHGAPFADATYTVLWMQRNLEKIWGKCHIKHVLWNCMVGKYLINRGSYTSGHFI